MEGKGDSATKRSIWERLRGLTVKKDAKLEESKTNQDLVELAKLIQDPSYSSLKILEDLPTDGRRLIYEMLKMSLTSPVFDADSSNPERLEQKIQAINLLGDHLATIIDPDYQANPDETTKLQQIANKPKPIQYKEAIKHVVTDLPTRDIALILNKLSPMTESEKNQYGYRPPNQSPIPYEPNLSGIDLTKI